MCSAGGPSSSLAFLASGGMNPFSTGIPAENGSSYRPPRVTRSSPEVFFDGELSNMFSLFANKLAANDSVWRGVRGKFSIGLVGEGRLGDLIRGGTGGSSRLRCNSGRVRGVGRGWGNPLIGGGTQGGKLPFGGHRREAQIPLATGL